MARSKNVRAGALVLLVLCAGCAAKVQAKASTSDDAPPRDEAAPRGFDTPAEPAPTSSSAEAPAPSAAPTASTEPVKPRPGCGLVCVAPQKGRVAPEDEARLAQGLADVTQSLHECVAGPIPSMTLRFDSTAALTGFGVAYDGGDTRNSCIDAINMRHPSVTYPGPATLRCSERCEGSSTPRARRTRRR